jgi:putative membrane protein
MNNRNIASGICALFLLGTAGRALAADLSSSDKQFLITAAKTDMIEAHEGQMAENQASRSDVKDFARTLVQDHTDDYGRLTTLASKVGVSIPTGINSAKEHGIAPLARLKGDRFDREFTSEEVADHKRVLAEFRREAEHGKDPDVKAYASAEIPVLEKHLHLAESCEKGGGHTQMASK